jgi:hypothetical protein
MRHLRTALALTLFVLCAGTPAEAVVFARDEIRLFHGGAQATDAAVIAIPRGEAPRLCEGGTLWLQQRPDVYPREITFYWHVGRGVVTETAWRAQPAAQRSAPTYEALLRDLAEDADGSVTLTIPSLEAEPALSPRPEATPRNGGTGGRIGQPRRFEVNLETGSLRQVLNRPAPASSDRAHAPVGQLDSVVLAAIGMVALIAFGIGLSRVLRSLSTATRK